MNQHKAAAANVARPREGDRQGKPCRHGRINRIAALLQHVEANLAGQLLRAHHHPRTTIGGQVAVLIIDDGRVCRGHRRQRALGTSQRNVAQVSARQKARSGGVKRVIIALANMVFPES